MKITDEKLDELLKSGENPDFDKTFAFKEQKNENNGKRLYRSLITAGAAALVTALVITTAIFATRTNTKAPDNAPETESGASANTESDTEETEKPELTPPSDPVKDGFGLLHVKNAGTDAVDVAPGKISGGAEAAPPQFLFHAGGIVVKVRLKEVHGDVFGSFFEKTKYRLLKLELIETVSGENVPDEILYLMPEYYFVDMSGYDFLYMALSQAGCEGYMLKDLSTDEICVSDSPVFMTVERSAPALGDVIAFSGGRFDESLWQNKNWIYGYQFAMHELEEDNNELAVKRGCDENYVRSRIAELKNESYISEPRAVFSVKNAPEELKAAFGYVAPFENGVFAHEMHGTGITYRRFINGCKTNEIISIDVGSREVAYSKNRFDAEEAENVYDIGAQVKALSEEYKKNAPEPPHFDPGELTLYGLSVEGYYEKTDSGVVSVIWTKWLYRADEGYRAFVYDERFTVYEDGKPRDVTTEELSRLVGYEVMPQYKYGEPFEVPFG